MCSIISIFIKDILCYIKDIAVILCSILMSYIYKGYFSVFVFFCVMFVWHTFDRVWSVAQRARTRVLATEQG